LRCKFRPFSTAPHDELAIFLFSSFRTPLASYEFRRVVRWLLGASSEYFGVRWLIHSISFFHSIPHFFHIAPIDYFYQIGWRIKELSELSELCELSELSELRAVVVVEAIHIVVEANSHDRQVVTRLSMLCLVAIRPISWLFDPSCLRCLCFFSFVWVEIVGFESKRLANLDLSKTDIYSKSLLSRSNSIHYHVFDQ